MKKTQSIPNQEKLIMDAKSHSRTNVHSLCRNYAAILKTFQIIVLLVALISPIGSALAQTNMAIYTFEGNSLSSSDSDTNSTASDITDSPTGTFSGEFGVFVTENTGGTPATSIANGWSARAENSAADTFFSFTITPTIDGGTMAFSALNFDAKVFSALGGTTAYNYDLYWSVDGFATAIGNATGPSQSGPGDPSYTALSIDLSALSGQTAAVTFRLDPVTASGGATNGAASQRRGSIDNVVLTGAVTPPSVGGVALFIEDAPSSLATRLWQPVVALPPVGLAGLAMGGVVATLGAMVWVVHRKKK